MQRLFLPVLPVLFLLGCGADSDNSNAPDITAPQLSGQFPADSAIVQSRLLTLTGSVSDDNKLSSVEIVSDGQSFPADLQLDDGGRSGQFSAALRLSGGLNTFQIVVSDAAGNQTRASHQAYFGKRVTAGGAHSGAIVEGKTYVWGRNNKGQLGLGMTSKQASDESHPLTPVLLPISKTFVSLAFNQNASLALAADGTVWSWGDGANGQLGLGSAAAEAADTSTRLTPVQVPGITDAVSVVRGYGHSLVLHNDGTVSAFGSNNLGQLGDGSALNRDYPVRLTLTDIVQVAASSGSSYALDEQGVLWGWGANDYANLGLASEDTEVHSTPVQIPLPQAITAVAAGRDHVLALGKSGQVYAWGLNFSSQVGLFVSEQWPEVVTSPQLLPWFSDVQAVWANANQSFVKRADGKVYPWGQNMLGTLGIEQDDDVEAPLSPILQFDNALDLGNGALHTLGLRGDGQLFSWGWSFEGSLGGSDLINLWGYRVPVLVSVPEAAAEAATSAAMVTSAP